MTNSLYLRKDTTQCMKGIFAVCILIHHLFQYSGLLQGTYLGVLFQALGYLSVGMFFFFSGYGLMLSSQKEGYIDTFLRKRLLPLYGFYLVLLFLYSVYGIILKNGFTLIGLLKSLTFGGTYVVNGWYLEATFILYIAYFFIFKFIKSNQIRLISFAAFLVVYCIVCKLIGLQTVWYESIFCFLLGMLCFYYKAMVDKLLEKRSLIILLISGVAFVGCFLAFKVLKTQIAILFKMFSSLLFAVAMISLSALLEKTHVIRNRFTTLLGKYSLQIYVSQGFLLLLRRNELVYIKNTLVFVLITIVGTAILSILLKYIYNGIAKLTQNKSLKSE